MMDNQSPTIPRQTITHKTCKKMSMIVLFQENEGRARKMGEFLWRQSYSKSYSSPCLQATCRRAGPRGNKRESEIRERKQPAKAVPSSFLQQLSRRWDELAPTPWSAELPQEAWVSLGSCPLSLVLSLLSHPASFFFLLSSLTSPLSHLLPPGTSLTLLSSHHRYQGLFPSFCVFSKHHCRLWWWI